MQSPFSPAPQLRGQRRTAAPSGKLFIISHVDYRMLRPDLTRLRPEQLTADRTARRTPVTDTLRSPGVNACKAPARLRDLAILTAVGPVSMAECRIGGAIGLLHRMRP